VEDDIFQVGELVEPYRVTPSIDLEYNSNFHVFDNSLVNVDTEVLNVVMSSSGQAQIDEDDIPMLSTLKIVVEMMTIQLKKKKKIIMTNYQNTKR